MTDNDKTTSTPSHPDNEGIIQKSLEDMRQRLRTAEMAIEALQARMAVPPHFQYTPPAMGFMPNPPPLFNGHNPYMGVMQGIYGRNGGGFDSHMDPMSGPFPTGPQSPPWRSIKPESLANLTSTVIEMCKDIGPFVKVLWTDSAVSEAPWNLIQCVDPHVSCPSVAQRICHTLEKSPHRQQCTLIMRGNKREMRLTAFVVWGEPCGLENEWPILGLIAEEKGRETKKLIL
jgi:hypothetical protein